MKHLQTFRVFPKIPDRIAFIETLSRNVWWCWKPHAKELFRRIDPGKWEKSGRNPLQFAAMVPQSRFEELAQDDSFIAHMEKVQERFTLRVADPKAGYEPALDETEVIAYISMEFGLHESIPLFAGGLGILAGDHLKAASNYGLPLVGIGLLYRHGYFRQFLDDNGWQQEAYPETDLYQLPLRRVRDADGNEIQIRVDGPFGEIRAAIWIMKVGRIRLYLLDTNILDNPPEIRNITANLYAGDQQTRLAQEALLGIGGIRALAKIGLTPVVCHMNEGHSAFSSLERLALLMRTHQIDLKTAMEIVPRTTVFTTHTPVAAGHDEFSVSMVRPVIKPFEEALGASEDEILRWGQPPGAKADAPVSMFILGARMAQHCNGVSRLHGAVARRMWMSLWPEKPEDEIPITHVTNGIHISSWISPEHALLFERYLGPEWYMCSREPKSIGRIDEIYDEELWRAHEMSRARLIATCRDQMVRQYAKRNAPAEIMSAAASVLKQGVLTIGFARRFATYKRAALLMHDPDRLEALLTDTSRPVQIIFAGKAHPRDTEGKELIRKIIDFARRPAVRKQIVFLENYDMHLARHMYQGADVWLNTPRRPLEACGTSGMKAAINGGLNLSILDGWWDEGYSPEVGWAIGQGEEHNGDTAYQDTIDAQALYNVLENEVIPAFYDRQQTDSPSAWIRKMRAAMKLAMSRFCSLRMVGEYDQRFYQIAAERMRTLIPDQAAEARKLAEQRQRYTDLWQAVRIEPPVRDVPRTYRVGDTVDVTARVHLGQLQPDEVEVQLYYGPLKTVDTVATGHIQPMTVVQQEENGTYMYGCAIACDGAGRYGFNARVVPVGDAWTQNAPDLLTWA